MNVVMSHKNKKTICRCKQWMAY